MNSDKIIDFFNKLWESKLEKIIQENIYLKEKNLRLENELDQYRKLNIKLKTEKEKLLEERRKIYVRKISKQN